YIGACDYVSIDEISDKIKVEIFPNPSSDLLQLKGDMNLKKALFKINNLAGQQQLSGIIEDGIDISNLPQGLYIISVFYDKGKSNLRFVKK
ncbi:MAG: T9SS C-terminal target domain-containing protein, partial [Flavobacteriia bacterium]|nr:T9SS C-terminal target domain-containing protein [Flavobacteriia bacterium]